MDQLLENEYWRKQKKMKQQINYLKYYRKKSKTICKTLKVGLNDIFVQKKTDMHKAYEQFNAEVEDVHRMKEQF